MKIIIRVMGAIALAMVLLSARALLHARSDAEGPGTINAKIKAWIKDARAVGKPMPSKERILFIGDSHSCFSGLSPKRFSSTIYDKLAKDGYAVALYAACGASAKSWAAGGATMCGYRMLTTDGKSVFEKRGKFPPAALLVRNYKPDRIIIELGDNLFQWKKGEDGLSRNLVNKKDVESQVQLLLAAISNESPKLLRPDSNNRPRCLWIGPTKGGKGPVYEKSPEELKAMADALQNILAGKCLFIDSTDMIGSYAGPDGLHLCDRLSADWGSRALEQIRQKLK